MKKIFVFILSLVVIITLAACNKTTTQEITNNQTTASQSSTESTSAGITQLTTQETSQTTTAEEIVFGLPTPQTGFYMRDADIIQTEDLNRLLVYTTNTISGEEENVIAIRLGAYDSTKGYAYGDEHIILTGSENGWDQYLGSASIVMGNFEYESQSYDYLLAYCGTTSISDSSFSIGLAVSNDPLGTWTRVGDTPVAEYDGDVYGSSYAGFYAPSLVNLDGESIVRLFYTWADAYGHFTYFIDIDATDLSNMDVSGFAMVPNNGNLSSGEDVTMIPNADFAYDSTNGTFFMVKDYSPSASLAPQVATRIELASIDESELYIAPNPNGWTSLRVYDFSDTPDFVYERLYSGAIVTDQFGHLLNEISIEIIYNVSDLEADNVYYIFSQHLETFTYITD